jgi:cold shock CspA family protein
VTSDQIIRCAVCKTPFLWTGGEQREALAGELEPSKPDRCPMCRRLAPAAGRLRGVVKWYSRNKGYGFITTVQGQDVFLHKSALGDGQALVAGQLVEFAVTQGSRGVQAASVDVLDVAPSASG